MTLSKVVITLIKAFKKKIVNRYILYLVRSCLSLLDLLRNIALKFCYAQDKFANTSGCYLNIKLVYYVISLISAIFSGLRTNEKIDQG